MKITRWLILVTLLVALLACNFPLVNPQIDQTQVDTPLPSASEETAAPSPDVTVVPTSTGTPVPSEILKDADMWRQYGTTTEALRAYQEAYNSSTDQHQQSAALLGIARTYYGASDCSNASQAVSVIIEQFPDSPEAAVAFYIKGQCAQLDGEYLLAAESFQRYIDLRPGTLTAFINTLKGDAYLAANDTQRALEAYLIVQENTEPANLPAIKIKIARAYTAMGDTTNALRTYQQVFDTSSDDYQKAQVNFLMGQIYLSLDMPEQAYLRFANSVENYPRAYDTYSGLVVLVEAGQSVSDLNRGLVDYYAGQYGLAVDAFSRYLNDTPEHDGTAHFYRGLSFYMMALANSATGSLDSPEAIALLNQAIEEWRVIIRDHPADRWYASAYDEISYAQWFGLDQYTEGAQTLLDFVAATPGAPEAPGFLFQAARIFERNNSLDEAATTWERVFNEYSASDLAYRALFLSGVTRFRQGNYDAAMTQFQRALVLGTLPEDRAAANLWVGKVLTALGDAKSANEYFQRAATEDPTGYYSERAQDILDGRPAYSTASTVNLGYDLDAEKPAAEAWLRQKFQISDEVDLSGLAELADNVNYQRGLAFLELDEVDNARNAFESARQEVQYDPILTYRLMNDLYRRGIFRSAILASRQILTLAGMSDAGTLDAPIYFNHIRFGVYFRELVVPTAAEENIPTLAFLSLMRQESLFDSAITSSAGARGLMQLMPATASEVAANMGYPPDFTLDDLYLPVVNIKLGARYLARQINYLDGDMMAAMAGYNGGPGNAAIWQELSRGDPDLFVECIRFDESRQYVMRIYENFEIYRKIYELP